jgi:hypothetical protein
MACTSHTVQQVTSTLHFLLNFSQVLSIQFSRLVMYSDFQCFGTHRGQPNIVKRITRAIPRINCYPTYSLTSFIPTCLRFFSDRQLKIFKQIKMIITCKLRYVMTMLPIPASYGIQMFSFIFSC